MICLDDRTLKHRIISDNSDSTLQHVKSSHVKQMVAVFASSSDWASFWTHLSGYLLNTNDGIIFKIIFVSSICNFFRQSFSSNKRSGICIMEIHLPTMD